MKVKLFTHTDLDGVGNAVVAKSAFEHVDVEYCDYKEINEKIAYFIKGEGYEKYDRIFITDISVNEEVAELINELHNKGVGFQLVDHHGTALWLAEKYPMWCEVRVEESNLFPVEESLALYNNYLNGKSEPTATRLKVMSSGTSLFYKFLRNKHLPNIEPNAKLKAFVETVRRYDTWEWNNVYKDDHPKSLNDLMYLIGREAFVERFANNPLPTFTETELKLLEVEQYRINKYIWNMKRKVKTKPLLIKGEPFNVAYVFAEQHGSLLGNAIAEEYGDTIDFVAIIDMASNKVSLRGIHDSIDLGKEVAKVFGGGGHAKSSGFEFDINLLDEVYLKAFKQEVHTKWTEQLRL